MRKPLSIGIADNRYVSKLDTTFQKKSNLYGIASGVTPCVLSNGSVGGVAVPDNTTVILRAYVTAQQIGIDAHGGWTVYAMLKSGIGTAAIVGIPVITDLTGVSPWTLALSVSGDKAVLTFTGGTNAVVEVYAEAEITTLVSGITLLSDPVGLVRPAGFPAIQVYQINPSGAYDSAYNPISLSPGSAVTVYVSTSGNDSTGDGSIGSPYATYGKALTVSGVTKIIFRAGTYYDAEHWNELYTNKSIHAEAYQNEVVVLGPHVSSTWTKTGGYSNIYQRSFTNASSLKVEVYDGKIIDSEGFPTQFTEVQDLATLDATPNAFLSQPASGKLYVRTSDDRDMTNGVQRRYVIPRIYSNGGARFKGAATPPTFYLRNLKVVGGGRSVYATVDSAVTGTLVVDSCCIIGPAYNTTPSGDTTNGIQVEGINLIVYNTKGKNMTNDWINSHPHAGVTPWVYVYNSPGKHIGISGVGSVNICTTHQGGFLFVVNTDGDDCYGGMQASINTGTQHIVYGGTMSNSHGDGLNSDYALAYGALNGGTTMWLIGVKDSGCTHSILAETGSTVYYTSDCVFNGDKITRGTGQIIPI